MAIRLLPPTFLLLLANFLSFGMNDGGKHVESYFSLLISPSATLRKWMSGLCLRHSDLASVDPRPCNRLSQSNPVAMVFIIVVLCVVIDEFLNL